ncbi:MAG: hypothetical protein JWN45_1165 [Acidobacteriaceae bacterium]|nr:hypothetical protein [Acidobacteriaceae bacterium]
MENYFNYFTEIEEQYQRRRGAALLMSTLDWALIETWKDAGIPLEAVLRGIDSAFNSYDSKPARAKTRKVNSLAYCSQEVLAAAEEMKEAATGSPAKTNAEAPGMEASAVAAFLNRNAAALENAAVSPGVKTLTSQFADSLRSLAKLISAGESPKLEDLERQLTVMEEKLFASLLTSTADAELLEVRAQADRDIAPYRSKMISAQIEQLHRQYVNKRLLERAKLPRLSLFYM